MNLVNWKSGMGRSLKRMRISSAVRTHRGNIREENEDNFLIDGRFRELSTQDVSFESALTLLEESSSHFYAVCDGMGGEHYGEIASLIAVLALDELSRTMPEHRFEEYIPKVNSIVCAEMDRRKVHRMGTTVAALRIYERQVTICNLGDSRVYVYNDQRLRQLSEDHREKVPSRKGMALTQHLGIRQDEFELEPFVRGEIEICPDMLFLLCSDGLTDMVTYGELDELMSEHINDSAQQIADRLVERALQNGGKDNVTALIVKLDQK